MYQNPKTPKPQRAKTILRIIGGFLQLNKREIGTLGTYLRMESFFSWLFFRSACYIGSI